MTEGNPPRRPFVMGPGGRPARPRQPAHATRGQLLVAYALAAVVLLILVAPAIARRLTDWMWYREIGFERVFLTKVAAQWTLGLIVGVGAFLLFYGNARFALRDLILDAVAPVDRARGGPRTEAAVIARLASLLAVPVSALLAGLLALAAATEWRTLAQFFYRTPFGFTDPIFGRDVAYYVFTLPVIEIALGYATLALLLALAVVTLPIYFARGEIGKSWNMPLGALAEVHVAVLGAIVVAVFGLQVLLVAVPSVLQASHSALEGASYTDLHVRVVTLRILGALAFLSAAIVLWRARRGRLARDAGITLGSYVALTMLLVGLVPAAFQRLVVQPNELAREAPQITHHIEATRRAWGIDNVERRELGVQQQLSLRDIEANRTTISNVRLWDREPLLQTFGQIQAIRTYYDFVAVDDDRYRINGELRQVMLSARELNTTTLPTRSFINEHLTFTHGMGLTLGPSNQVTTEGLPVLWIKDLPPSASIPINVTRPQIYFGELSNEFILAPTSQRELDYPAGEGDAAVYSTYTGRAGVSVGSFARRLLFALRFRSINILLSRDVTPQTRILFNRSVKERAMLALPFLRFDRDPYVVIADDGSLKWILDAYTVTNRFPYSQRMADGTNYMRNSVKVVIDAYDGDLHAYLVDPADPMIRTYSRIYPGLLRPIEEMPAGLRAHLRYPEDLFRAQTALYATFHMTNPETFYHREDQWQVPGIERTAEGGTFMRHMVMRLPGEAEPEFILMRPFTPRQKDNLAAWIVARNDGEHYGKLVAYRFPRQSLVFGPTQIVNRINQDTEVSRQVALWNQGGSEVIRGELLVIPIEESLLYVQPLYLRSQGGRIPELKRVIVAHENRVAMDETLEAGLRRLFAGEGAAVPVVADAAGRVPAAAAGAGPRATATDSGLTPLLREASLHYERARAAQRADDWTTYGEEMRKLGDALQRLNAARPPK